MEAWCDLNRKYAKTGKPFSKLASGPPTSYEDEETWAYVYIHSHDVATTGPMIRVALRFAHRLPPEALCRSIEYMGYMEVLATDGLKEETELIPTSYVPDAARLLVWIYKVRCALMKKDGATDRLVTCARTFCESRNIKTSHEASAMIELYLALHIPSPMSRILLRLKMEEETDGTGYGRWRSTYDSLLRLVQSKPDALIDSESTMVYYRLMYAAAATVDDPHPWMRAACEAIRPYRPLPPPTSYVEIAVERVRWRRLGFLNPAYVKRVHASIPPRHPPKSPTV